MENVLAVQCSQSFAHFNEYFPDGRLSDHSLSFLILHNLLIQIAIVQIVHDNAQT